jgi:hypothetical protein
MALYLYGLGLVLPPAAVVVGVLMLLIPRKAATPHTELVARAA